MPTERQEQIRASGGCACHLYPPCPFCTMLHEDEIEAYAKGGMDAVEELWESLSPEEANITDEELAELNRLAHGEPTSKADYYEDGRY